MIPHRVRTMGRASRAPTALGCSSVSVLLDTGASGVKQVSLFFIITSAFGTWSEAHSSFQKIDMACKTPNLLKHRFGGIVVPSSFL